MTAWKQLIGNRSSPFSFQRLPRLWRRLWRGAVLALLGTACIAGASVAAAQSSSRSSPQSSPQSSPLAALLSDADRADIARIERYINEIETLQARFLQVSSTGDYAEGTLFLWRPGRLRIEYDPPNPILIVANRTWLIYEDKELEQITQLPLAATPADILVAENISLFSDAFTITRFERGAGSLRLTVTRAEDPLAGNITLVFSDRPLALKKWTVIDAQGVATTVSLLGSRLGAPLNPKLFEFELPEEPMDGQ